MEICQPNQFTYFSIFVHFRIMPTEFVLFSVQNSWKYTNIFNSHIFPYLYNSELRRACVILCTKLIWKYANIFNFSISVHSRTSPKLSLHYSLYKTPVEICQPNQFAYFSIFVHFKIKLTEFMIFSVQNSFGNTPTYSILKYFSLFAHFRIMPSLRYSLHKTLLEIHQDFQFFHICTLQQFAYFSMYSM